MVAAGTPDLRASVDIFTSPSASCFGISAAPGENYDFQLSSSFVRIDQVFRVRNVDIGTIQRRYSPADARSSRLGSRGIRPESSVDRAPPRARARGGRLWAGV